MQIGKYSKDPKVELISMQDLFDYYDSFFCCEDRLYSDKQIPKDMWHMKITPSAFVVLQSRWTKKNYGLDDTEIIDKIYVALRDGKTEYELFEDKLNDLITIKNDSNSKKVQKQIDNMTNAKAIIYSVPYCEKIKPIQQDFNDCLKDSDYKTEIDILKNKYVVFDVETNGVRRKNDDLLSLSIYDPTSGKVYTRFLPLDLLPIVLTGQINGITEKDLETKSHLTQEEIDKIIDCFDLKNKTLLSFSGGNGTFDFNFLINYCKRHKLVGFENLKYENIKAMCPQPGMCFEGRMTKDNLCRLLKIDGVNNIHSAENDCILEWKLFEKIKTKNLIFIGENLYHFSKDYIIPVTYINGYPKLLEYSDVFVPRIVGKANCIYECFLPDEILPHIKKYGTNITGISLENAISAALKAETQDNTAYLLRNKRNIEYIGTLESRINKIPIEIDSDGTIKSLDRRFDEQINEVNDVARMFVDAIKPMIDFIKEYIFTSGKIKNQEMVISDDGKILALCDLSDDNAVLEIKTYDILRDSNEIAESIARQLFYQRKGRKTYALSIRFDTKIIEGELLTEAVSINLYEIELQVFENEPTSRKERISEINIKIMKIIQNNLSITNAEIARMIGITQNTVGRKIAWLERFGYIVKKDGSGRKTEWVVLRSPEDKETKVYFKDGQFVPILKDSDK